MAVLRFALHLLTFILTGANAQTIVDFPLNPLGGAGGEPVLLTCGVTSVNQVLWTHPTLGTVYSSASDQTASGFSMHRETVGNVEYFNLQIDSATKAQSGEYTCNALIDEQTVSVLIFDFPVFATAEFVEGDSSFQCEVTFGAPSSDISLFSFHIEDEMGQTTSLYNDTVDETGGVTSLVRTQYSFSEELTWEDDGQNYACVVTMTDFHLNTTVTISVLHAANDFDISPSSGGNVYCQGDILTVLYSSNPAAKQWQWYIWRSEGWELIDGDDNQDAQVTVSNEWFENTVLQVRVVNAFDHNGDGTITDQTGVYTFGIYAVVCDSTSGSGDDDIIPSTTLPPPPTTTAQEQEKVPAISVLLTEDAVFDSSPLVFDNVITNIGDGYSDISGVFTVPTHGLYQLSASMLSRPGENFTLQLLRNGDTLCRGFADSAEYQTASCSAVVELFVDDEVYVNCPEDSLPLVRGNGYSGLSGFLIQKYE